MSCEQHWPYPSAIADNELELVPASTLAHVRACPTYGREVETHSPMTTRLRTRCARFQPVWVGVAPRLGDSRRATLLVAVLAATLTVWRGLGSQDNVLAAASVAQRPAQFHSTDEAAVGAWCERESGRVMPVVALPSLTPQCARADRVASVRMVTVQYKTGVGSRVTMSWLNDTPRPPEHQ